MQMAHDFKFDDKGRKLTLCRILKTIAEKTNDEEIKGLANEATVIAKKIDVRLKIYAGRAKKQAHELEVGGWQ